jgi:hypothetical protein
VEDDQMTTRVIDTDAREEEREDDERWIDAESGGRGGWDDDGDDDAIPPRPRGRLLRPLPLALIAMIIAAAGFLGGIEAQKGSEGGGAAAGPGGGGLPSFAAMKEAASGEGSTGGSVSASGEGAPGGSESTSGAVAGDGSHSAGGEGAASGAESSGGEGAAGGSESTAAAGGAPSFGGSSAAATGTVTSVEGHTIYVKEADGTTVAVKAGDGSTVTRDSNVAAKKIHPGDTVVVQGSKKGSTVTASSIAATESGVESTAAGLGAATTSGASEPETSVESLFEE